MNAQGCLHEYFEVERSEPPDDCVQVGKPCVDRPRGTQEGQGEDQSPGEEGRDEKTIQIVLDRAPKPTVFSATSDQNFGQAVS